RGAARAAPLLADLRGARAREPARGRACVRLRRLSGDRERLAVLLYRGDGRAFAVLPVAAAQHGDRGRVLALSEIEAGADRSLLRLAAGTQMAARQDLEPAAGRDSASSTPALGNHPRTRVD